MVGTLLFLATSVSDVKMWISIRRVALDGSIERCSDGKVEGLVKPFMRNA